MISFKFPLAIALSFIVSAVQVLAETHTVVFENDCGFGNPILKAQSGTVLSNGEAFTINGPLVGAIAFLQTGLCGNNGEGCTIVEITLRNPTSPETGSSVDINLTSPHNFTIPIGFGYFNGCDGIGQECTTSNCPMPGPSQPGPLSATCRAANVNLAVTFCD